MKNQTPYFSQFDEQYLNLITFYLSHQRLPNINKSNSEIVLSEEFKTIYKTKTQIIKGCSEYVYNLYEGYFLEDIRGLCGYEIIRHYYDVYSYIYKSNSIILAFYLSLRDNYPTIFKSLSKKMQDLSFQVFFKGYHKGSHDHTVKRIDKIEELFEVTSESLLTFITTYPYSEHNEKQLKMLIDIYDLALRYIR